MILGIGAGWQEREHTLFGHELGDIPTRMARLQEGLEVVTRLLRSDEPVTFEGKFFQLRGAILLPRPQRPGGPEILIGGNGVKRTLPLVARYANIWNGTFLSPDKFRELSAVLDTLLQEVGRKPSDVKRTMMHTATFGSDTPQAPDVLIQHIKAYEEAGVEELMLQWFDTDNIDGLRAFAENVLHKL